MKLWLVQINLLSITIRHKKNLLLKSYYLILIFIIDINPRFGGGYPFTHLSGHNYLKAIIAMYLGNDYELKKIGKNIKASKGIKINFANY